MGYVSFQESITNGLIADGGWTSLVHGGCHQAPGFLSPALNKTQETAVRETFSNHSVNDENEPTYNVGSFLEDFRTV